MSVNFVASAKLPTQWGEFDILGFLDESTGKEHVILAKGFDLDNKQAVEKAGLAPMIRIHSECLTGDALFSMRCDCGPQLESALQRIAKDGRGAVLYLRQEGRGIGLLNKIKAYQLQDEGADTVEANEQLGFNADQREYDMCSAMLDYLQIKQLRLLTNNPNKVSALENLGYEVVERLSLQTGQNPHNEKYLQVKKGKLGHLMDAQQD